MGTRLWGPDTWYVIHVIADSAPTNFTQEDTDNYEKFYWYLAEVLPCPSCGAHFKEFMNKDPPIFKTRMEALLWTVRAHNNANEHTEKRVLTDDEGLAAIQAEIEARDSGRVRGRRPTFTEYILDTSIPLGVGVFIGLLLMFIIFRKKILDA